MKKQRKSVNRKAQQKQRKQKKPAMSDGTHDRRGFLKYLRTGAITAVVLGGVGVIGARMVNASMAEQDLTKIDTKNILFICGGAFDGLEKIIARRLGRKVVGFKSESKAIGNNISELLKNIEDEDLLSYGLIPEIIGRLPVVCSLSELDKDALKTILTQPKNALVKQYKYYFKLEDIELEFDDNALDAIVEAAQKHGTGARALRSILESSMMDIMYEAPSMHDLQKCIITRELIISGGKSVGSVGPEFVYKQKRKRA